jgi:hypothetical protein
MKGSASFIYSCTNARSCIPPSMNVSRRATSLSVTIRPHLLQSPSADQHLAQGLAIPMGNAARRRRRMPALLGQKSLDKMPDRVHDQVHA